MIKKLMCGLLIMLGLAAPAAAQGPYGAQVQRAVAASQQYGEMFLYDNTTATALATNAVYTAVRLFSTGAVLKGFTFNAGSTGPISAYANYGATVTGTVLVTDTAHGLVTGDVITITGSTNYNGTFTVTRVGADTFYITDTWVADDGAGNWFQGSYLQAQVPGIYLVSLSLTIEGAAATAENYHVELNKNATELNNTAIERTVSATGSIGSMGALGVVRLAVGDRIWVSVKQTSSGTDNVTFNHGNVTLTRIGG